VTRPRGVLQAEPQSGRDRVDSRRYRRSACPGCRVVGEIGERVAGQQHVGSGGTPQVVSCPMPASRPGSMTRAWTGSSLFGPVMVRFGRREWSAEASSAVGTGRICTGSPQPATSIVTLIGQASRGGPAWASGLTATVNSLGVDGSRRCVHVDENGGARASARIQPIVAVRSRSGICGPMPRI